ncbi:uncharacterized protein LOC113291706 [Papaver somniferum]|uniref:uncharacterized protein LOC113291706 n=1 Tax=Papaver somniferum TaxID=3469 RepID=UPI000E7041CF|nr:uncharacterized protein LOC113291706 [Papaver somniferum]
MAGTDGEGENPPVKSLRDYMYPTRVSQPSCIVLPATTVTYEIRTNTLQALPNFYGKENENPYYHIRDFEELCGTVKIKNLSDEYLKLRLFPFSLKDKAKSWLYALAPSSVRTWEYMTKLFLNNFFPRHKTSSIHQKLNSFVQQQGESLWDYLERFHDLLLQCPHHGFDTLRLTLILYEGLDHKTMTTVESLCDSNFQDKSAEEGYAFLQEVAEKTQEWDAKEPVRLESLEHSSKSKPFVESPDQAFYDDGSEQANALYQDNRRKYDPYSNLTTQGGKDTLTFHGLEVSMKATQKSITNLEHTTARSIANKERQVGQLASQMNDRDKGQFPSHTKPNPKGSFEVRTSGAKSSNQVQDVTSLRSGRVIDNHVSNPKENEHARNTPIVMQVTPATQKEANESEITYVPRATFPQRLLPRKKGTSSSDILEVFKQVNINIPLLHAIKQIPLYAKFLKDMCTVKRNLNVQKRSFLAEQVSSIITQKTPYLGKKTRFCYFAFCKSYALLIIIFIIFDGF